MSAPAYSELHEHLVRVEDLPQLVSGDPATWYVNGASARGESAPVWGFLTGAELVQPLPGDAYDAPGVLVKLGKTSADDGVTFAHWLGLTVPRVRNVDGRAVVEATAHRVRLSRSIPTGGLCSVCGARVTDPREGVTR